MYTNNGATGKHRQNFREVFVHRKWSFKTVRLGLGKPLKFGNLAVMPKLGVSFMF